MSEYNLIDNIFTEEKVEEAVRDLFSENGTVYIIAGYFSRSGYLAMRKSMKEFLERNENNRIVVIVGTEPNQFSATIAYDLWEMDTEGKVELLKYSEHFVHTKHYVRDNENPAVILGSANFTREGLKEHLELVSFYEAKKSEDPIPQQHIEWFKKLAEDCEPVTEEDLKKYKRKRVEVEFIEESELLEKLGISLQEVEEKLNNLDPFPIYYLNLLSNYLEIEDTEKATVAIKSRIKKYPHQIVAASQAYRNLSYHGFYLLADEVGLGKTFEAGLVLKQLKFTGKVRRALIVCNASAMNDWESAMKKFYEDSTIITSSKKADWKQSGFSERDIWLKDDLMICTPQMFRQAVEKNTTNPEDWDILILDEAHIVKNSSSESYQKVKDFDVKYKLFLTATPVQNKEKEFYNLFNAMREGFLGPDYQSYKSSGEKYLRDLLQGEKESLLKRFLRNELPYMEIPPRKVNDFFVTLSEEEYKVYSAFLNFLKDLVERNPESAAHFVSIIYQKIAASSWFSLEASMKKLRRLHKEVGTAEIKLTDFEKSVEEEGRSTFINYEEPNLEVNMDLLDDLIKELEEIDFESKLTKVVDAISDILEEEDKIVVFTQYKRNLLPKSQLKERVTGENLFSALRNSDEINCPVYIYHGSMNTTERYEIRKKFEETGGIFLTTEAGAESINLQHCSVMLNFDIPWNPAKIEQRIGRIQRLGQEKEIAIFNLILSGTLDESVYKKVVRKHNLLQQRFGSSEEVTQREALEAVESGSLEEISSTSEIFIQALQERKGSEEIKEYFERLLDERDEELEKLRANMEKNLKNFDDRIKILLTGITEDTSEVEKRMEELSKEYKEILKSYLTYLQFTENIDINFKAGEVVLKGDEEILGDNKINVALDGETSLFRDLSLLTPKQNPLQKLLEKTKRDFSLTGIKYHENGIVFDFLVEVNSPINTIQKIIRIKTNGSTEEVIREFPKDGEKISNIQTTIIPSLISMLENVYSNVKSKAEAELEKEKEELEGFINSEISRLHKKKTEEIRNSIKKKVIDPITLQESKVKKLKKQLNEGKIKGKDLENARRDLQRRRSNRKQKEMKLRSEIKEVYDKKLGKIRNRKKECNYKIKLLSACILVS